MQRHPLLLGGYFAQHGLLTFMLFMLCFWSIRLYHKVNFQDDLCRLYMMWWKETGSVAWTGEEDQGVDVGQAPHSL